MCKYSSITAATHDCAITHSAFSYSHFISALAKAILIFASTTVFTTGCATTPTPMVVNNWSGMKDSLSAASDRLKKGDIASQLGGPSDKVDMENGGEVWTYRFGAIGQTRSSGVATPFMFGSTIANGSSYTEQYSGSVILTFDATNILRDYRWDFNGNLNLVGVNPFARLLAFPNSIPVPKGGLRIFGFLQNTNEFYICGVEIDSNASRAGLCPGDVIISIDGKYLWGHRTMTVLLSGEPGSKVTLRCRRSGLKDIHTIEVVREIMTVERILSTDKTPFFN